jgi:hypothetical protein
MLLFLMTQFFNESTLSCCCIAFRTVQAIVCVLQFRENAHFRAAQLLVLVCFVLRKIVLLFYSFLLSKAQPDNAIVTPLPKFGNDCLPRVCPHPNACPPAQLFFSYVSKLSVKILQLYKSQNVTILQGSKFYNSTRVKILQFYKCQNFTILQVSKCYNSTSVKMLQFYKCQNVTVLQVSKFNNSTSVKMLQFSCFAQPQSKCLLLFTNKSTPKFGPLSENSPSLVTLIGSLMVNLSWYVGE